MDDITSTQTIFVYAETGSCPDVSENSFTVTINDTPLADAPADVTMCDSYTLPALTNGSYFATTGGVDPIASGTSITSTQTIYVYAETGTTPNCFTENSFTVTINDSPIITNPGPQTVCDSYTLPTITGTNLTGNEAYYNNRQALCGTVITGPITSTQTVWIYDATALKGKL